MEQSTVVMKYFLFISFLLISVSNYSFGQQSIPNDTLITLERDPGFFGRIGLSPCPFYKLTISADGKVQLEPKDYQDQRVVTGKIIKSRISSKQLKQIVAEFEAINFYSLSSTFENPDKNNRKDCPIRGEDGTTAIISITMNGKTKLVEHYHGCYNNESLLKLTNLENKIDEIVNIRKWIDCDKGKNRIKLSR